MFGSGNRPPRTPAGPAVYTVEVVVTAIGVAASSALPALASIELPPVVIGRGGAVTQLRRIPVTHRLKVAAEGRGQVKVSLVVDHAGRRHQEDDLILVGAL